MAVVISWCGKQFTCKRLIINSKMPEAGVLAGFAAALRVPVVRVEGFQTEEVLPEAHDLWVGTSPKNGYNGLEGDCGEARSIEAQSVVERLKNAEMV